MALTKDQIRKILNTAGVADEQIPEAVEAILDGHLISINALREEVSKYKEEAEKLEAVQKELDTLKAKGDDGYKAKYEAEKAAHDALKADIAAKETKKAKTDAYRELLKGANIDEKRIATILRAEAPTIDKIELDADGKIKNAEQYTESIKSDWADFIVTQSAKGANTATPPAHGGAATTKTKEDILKIKDAGERQKAIAENPTLFGID